MLVKCGIKSPEAHPLGIDNSQVVYYTDEVLRNTLW